jgi:hypothetical protein
MARLIVHVALVATALLLAGFYFVFRMEAGSPPMVRLGAAALGGIALPYVLAEVLVVAGRRSHGYALALGSAAVFLVPLLPWAAVLLFFVGFSQSKMQLASTEILVGLAGVQVALLASAWRAYRGLAPSERVPGALGLGFAGPILYVGLLWGAGQLFNQRIRAQSRTARANESAARETVRRLVDCARAFASEHPERGYPERAAELGPEGSGCLAEDAAAGHGPGYRFEYAAGVADATGRVRLFSVCAQPLSLDSGVYTIVADQDGRSGEGVPPDAAAVEAGRSLACSAAWGDGSFSRVATCLVRYAAAHPEAGYPRDVEPLGPRGDGCLQALGASEFEATRFSLWGTVYQYLPGPPDAAGRTASFEVRAVPSDGGSLEVLDETGRIRVVAPGQPLAEAPTREGLAEARCDAGEVRDCSTLADQAARGVAGPVDPARALAFYERACELGERSQCLVAASYAEHEPALAGDRPRRARLLRHACEAGIPEGCQRLEALAADGERS